MSNKAAPDPDPSRTQPGVSITCFREVSENWTQARLAHLAARPLSNPVLPRIDDRRRELAAMPPWQLHPSYTGQNSHAGQAFVTPKTISLSRLYGRLLYSVAADIRAKCILEAGAGLGISGMYLGAAAALTQNARFLSFEIGEYADIARESITSVFEPGEVHAEEFENFARHLLPNQAVDFCFLDSKHDEETIIRNYKSVLGWMNSGSVLVIDDIMSTPGARIAWNTIVARQDFPFIAIVRNRLGFLAR